MCLSVEKQRNRNCLTRRRVDLAFAILKDVELLSEGRIVLSTGTLYGALARLLEQGVIRRSNDDSGSSGSNNRSDSVDIQKRKYYELTQFGYRVLAVEIKRMGTILATANRELGVEFLNQ